MSIKQPRPPGMKNTKRRTKCGVRGANGPGGGQPLTPRHELHRTVVGGSLAALDAMLAKLGDGTKTNR